MKNKLHNYLIIIIITIILFALLSFFSFDLLDNNDKNEINNSTDNNNGLTALEGREIADKIAIDWEQNSFLTDVTGASINNYGKPNKWLYGYSNQNRSKEIVVHVYANGSSEQYEYSTYSFYTPIENWTIDSDIAYDIAITDPKIVEFMSKYSPYVDSFSLGGDINKSKILSWDIAWSDSGLFDNPKWASIKIDANTGEVIYVKTDE